MKPEARSAGLLTREIAGELVVYDLERHRAHCLNRTAAWLWRRCDGATGVEQLAGELDESCGIEGSADAVALGLRQLAKARLLHDEDRARVGPGLRTRRQLLRQLGLAGPLAALLPLVTTIVAPTAAMAQTCLPLNASCGASAQCCSGCCGPSNKCKNNGACLP